jgi:hypothetical protein
MLPIEWIFPIYEWPRSVSPFKISSSEEKKIRTALSSNALQFCSYFNYTSGAISSKDYWC